MATDTIMFCFGGRRPNLELQLPYIHRILAEHPDVEYHLWNLARDDADMSWISSLRHIDYGPRFKVFNDFAGAEPGRHFNDVYHYYAAPQFSGRKFVKLDDDIVFIQTGTFGRFLEAITVDPRSVVSASVINNGACLSGFTDLYAQWRKTFPRQHILDVHRFPEFMRISHSYMLEDWLDLLTGGVHSLRECEDWMSINFIGFNHATTLGRIVELLDRPSPQRIAGRHFSRNTLIGDEGAVNMLPRAILRGFVVSHLTFGPQERKMSVGELDEWRGRYRDLRQKYLEVTQ